MSLITSGLRSNVASFASELAPLIAAAAAAAMSGFSAITRVVGLVGLELGLDLRLGRGDVRRALDLQVGHVAAEALLDAVAALLEADVVLLVDDAEHLLGALGLKRRRRPGPRSTRPGRRG